jgi:hypothetical protein
MCHGNVEGTSSLLGPQIWGLSLMPLTFVFHCFLPLCKAQLMGFGPFEFSQMRRKKYILKKSVNA